MPLASTSVRPLRLARLPLLIRQAPPIPASPSTRAQMSKSVGASLHRSSTNRRSVANEQGNFTTPSFVSFTAEERLIGEAAKNQAAMNPTNTVFDVKYAYCVR